MSTPPFSFDPLHASDADVLARNRNEGRSGISEFAPTEAAIQAASTARSAVPERIASWAHHPDERVALALLRNGSLVRLPGKGHSEDLQSVQSAARVLPAHAVAQARARGLAWTATLDALSRTDIASLRRPGLRFLRDEIEARGPLFQWVSRLGEAEVLELLDKAGPDFRWAVYGALSCFSEGVWSRAEQDAPAGPHGLSTNPGLPTAWVERLSREALDRLAPPGVSSTYWQSGRYSLPRLSVEDAAGVFARLASAGHRVPEAAVERLKEVATPKESDAAYMWPINRVLALHALLRTEGALGEAALRRILASDVWTERNLPVEQLLEHPAMPADLWPALLNRHPGLLERVSPHLRERVRSGNSDRSIRDVLRGEPASSLLPHLWESGPEEFRATWRVVAAREPKVALDLMEHLTPEQRAWLRREDWYFLVAEVRCGDGPRTGQRSYGGVRRVALAETAGRILLRIPGAADDPEVRPALLASGDPALVAELLAESRADETRVLFRRLAMLDLERLARAIVAEGAESWIGRIEREDLLPLLVATSATAREAAIAAMGKVGALRDPDRPAWRELRAQLETESAEQCDRAVRLAVETCPFELVDWLSSPEGADHRARLGAAVLPLLARHPDPWIRAEALLLFPGGPKRQSARGRRL
jgi:hypothetical protein